MRIKSCILSAILLAFMVVLTGCDIEEDGYGVTQPEYETHPKETIEPEIDEYVGEDIEDFLDALRDVGKAGIAVALEERIERAKDHVSRYGGGYVIVGRVVADGPIDPRDVNAQMLILEEGYFAGPVKDLHRPVGFRLHGYAPFDLELEGKEGKPGCVTNVGTIRMIPLPAGRLASLRGRLVLDGDVNPTMADIELSITKGPVNTPSNGTEGRPYWPDPVRATILPSGEFFAEGVSPTEYYISFSEQGHVGQWRLMDFRPGETRDLGTVRLEVPKKIRLTYYVWNEPVFHQAEEKQEIIDAGARWVSEPDRMAWGWDLEFKQEKDVITFNWSYGPCKIADLGPGEIADFLNVSTRRLEFVFPNALQPKHGHVYLLDQWACFAHWVLFKLEIEGEVSGNLVEAWS